MEETLFQHYASNFLPSKKLSLLMYILSRGRLAVFISIQWNTIFLIDMSEEKYLEQLSSHSRYIVKQLPIIKTLKHNYNLNSHRRSYAQALFAQLILKFFHGFTVRYFSFPFRYQKLVNSLPPNVTLYSQSNSKNKRQNHLYNLKAPSALYFQITMNIVM